MAISIVGGTGFQYGIELAETGINCESFECEYLPYVNAKLEGITGEPIVRAQSGKLSRNVSINGEVKGSTGIMAFAVATALTVANDVSTFGDGSGSLLFDSMTETQNRSGWRSIAARISSDPLCVV